MTRSVADGRLARRGRRLDGTPPAPWRWVRSGLSSTAVGRRATAAQEGRRPQRVTAVVARADDRAHAAAGDPAGAGRSSADDRGGQPVGGTTHQCAVGQAGQQRRLGVADRVGSVVVPHRHQRYVLDAG